MGALSPAQANTASHLLLSFNLLHFLCGRPQKAHLWFLGCKPKFLAHTASLDANDAALDQYRQQIESLRADAAKAWNGRRTGFVLKGGFDMWLMGLANELWLPEAVSKRETYLLRSLREHGIGVITGRLLEISTGSMFHLGKTG